MNDINDKIPANHRARRRGLASAVAAVALFGVVAAACGDDDDTSAQTGSTTTAAAAMNESGDIVDVATEAGDFTVLLAAAMNAGLVDELQAPGPLTVFAPTDEAFAAALEDLGLTQDELLADTDTLESILLYHVVDGEVPAAEVLKLDGKPVETLNGAPVTVTVTGGKVKLNDDANVVATDVEATNGVIHVLDAVLLPPTS